MLQSSWMVKELRHKESSISVSCSKPGLEEKEKKKKKVLHQHLSRNGKKDRKEKITEFLTCMNSIVRKYLTIYNIFGIVLIIEIRLAVPSISSTRHTFFFLHQHRLSQVTTECKLTKSCYPSLSISCKNVNRVLDIVKSLNDNLIKQK